MPCPIEYLSHFPYFQYGHHSFPQTQQQWSLLGGWGCGKAAFRWTSTGAAYRKSTSYTSPKLVTSLDHISCKSEKILLPRQNWTNLTWKGTISKTLLHYFKNPCWKSKLRKLPLSDWLALRIHGQGFPYLHEPGVYPKLIFGWSDVLPPFYETSLKRV